MYWHDIYGLRAGNSPLVLDEGQYNVVCSGVGKGLFIPSSNWRKTITLERGQKYHQSFTCQKIYD